MLWESGIHEARILAGFIDNPADVTGYQLERWILTVDLWDLCERLCSNLIVRTLFAYNKAAEWSFRDALRELSGEKMSTKIQKYK